MATRYTTTAGDFGTAANWDGASTLPSAGDIVQVRHAMTASAAVTYPSTGGYASIDFNAAGGSAPKLTVSSGAPRFNSLVFNGIQTIVDSSATGLTLGTSTGALATVSASANAGYAPLAPVATPTHIIGNLTVNSGTTDVTSLTLAASTGLTVDGTITTSSPLEVGIYVGTSAILIAGVSLSASAGVSNGIFNLGTIHTPNCSGTTSGYNVHGIYVPGGTINGIGGTGPCVLTGTSTYAGAGGHGIYFTLGTITANCVGTTASTTGCGIFIGLGGAATITGDIQGLCGPGGSSIWFDYEASLVGNILLSNNRYSSIINRAQLRLASGNTTLVLGDASVFVPSPGIIIIEDD